MSEPMHGQLRRMFRRRSVAAIAAGGAVLVALSGLAVAGDLPTVNTERPGRAELAPPAAARAAMLRDAGDDDVAVDDSRPTGPPLSDASAEAITPTPSEAERPQTAELTP
jgi:hypothetical protein